MSIENNKQLIRDLAAAHERHDVAGVREILSPKLVWHSGGTPTAMGRDEYIEGLQMGARAFSDLSLVIQDMVAEADRVATRMTVRVRHTGTFQGIAPTEREIAFASMWLYHIVDHHVVESWSIDEDFTKKLGRSIGESHSRRT